MSNDMCKLNRACNIQPSEFSGIIRVGLWVPTSSLTILILSNNGYDLITREKGLQAIHQTLLTSIQMHNCSRLSRTTQSLFLASHLFVAFTPLLRSAVAITDMFKTSAFCFWLEYFWDKSFWSLHLPVPRGQQWVQHQGPCSHTAQGPWTAPRLHRWVIGASNMC